MTIASTRMAKFNTITKEASKTKASVVTATTVASETTPRTTATASETQSVEKRNIMDKLINRRPSIRN